MGIKELRDYLNADKANDLFYGDDKEILKKSLNEIEKYFKKKEYDKDVLTEGYRRLWRRMSNVVDKKYHEVFYSFVRLVNSLDKYKELNHYKEKIYQNIKSHKSIKALNTRLETLNKTPLNRYKENPTIQLSRSFVKALDDEDIE